MKDDGVDISANSSNNVEEYMSINFDFILTVCNHAHEHCPFFPSINAVRIHKNFIDPSTFDLSEEESINKFILVRDQIKEFCLNFANDNF
jgi:arsenate reductase